MIQLDMLQTMGLAVLFLLVGRWIREKISFFSKYCIPAPVIGGLIFAIFHLTLRQSGLGGFEFEETLKNFFMTIFFTSIGFNASFQTLKKGGLIVVKFLLVATLLAVFQNIVAVILAPVVKVPPLLALMTGSTAMTGGHGTSGGIAPHVEALGIVGAETVALASATFGLLAGSMMGGPLANRLITRFSLFDKKDSSNQGNILSDTVKVLKEEHLLSAFVHILIAMGLGVYVSGWISKTGLHFPGYIGAMLVAVVMRNISDAGLYKSPMNEISTAGNIGLNLFLAEALMTMKLWQLADLAIPMVVLLAAQCVITYLFVRFVTYYFMGHNYDSAVICAGHCGFGMGATANGMANMVSVCEKFSYSEQAFFVLPLVGALFIDFTNVAQIEAFINFLK
ncbi:sodium/glutamate symporter [Peptostreptococcaceae bacterium oral taxon 113 str. W5053]|nr:sodium/glutamate symporter [Peptostreptococcaceae bacterium oral taxon 113 str. W5053]